MTDRADIVAAPKRAPVEHELKCAPEYYDTPAKSEDEIILAMCRAHDREDSAQRGEPSPWWKDFDRDPDWEQERFLAMREAFDVAKRHLTAPQETGEAAAWRSDMTAAPMHTDILVWWPRVKTDDDDDLTDEIIDGAQIVTQRTGEDQWDEPPFIEGHGLHLDDDWTWALSPMFWQPLGPDPDHMNPLHPAPTPGGASEASSFQERVQPWMMACFGPEISSDRLERNDRFIEEALELAQASDYPKDRAQALVEYVYGRDQGDINQEVGGVMVTLAAHCLAHGVDMHAAAETELARIWTKVDVIRAKQAAKPTGSALPTAVPSPTPAGVEELAEALGPFAAFAEQVEQFVDARAKFGGSSIFPTNHFTLAHFQRAAAALSRFREGRGPALGQSGGAGD